MSATASISSSRRSTALNPDEVDLWELCHYAGVTIDPQVFRSLVDLLNMDIHPKAVIDVLKSIAPYSKYAVKVAEDEKKKKSGTVSSGPDQKLLEQKVNLRQGKIDIKPASASAKLTVNNTSTRTASSDRRSAHSNSSGVKSAKSTSSKQSGSTARVSKSSNKPQ